jgi:membrane-bound metal-dependent hydrolase YbcI (DUF457 family)
VDPLTHGLAGLVAGAALGADGPGIAVTVGGALLPDAEFVTRKIPRTAFLDYHHGLPHGLPGGAVLGVLWGTAASRLLGTPWAATTLLAVAGVASHILMDMLMHNNGIALWAPFSRRRTSMALVLGLNPQTASPQCRHRRYGTCLVCQGRWALHNPFTWILLLGSALMTALPRSRQPVALAVCAVAALFGLAVYRWKRRALHAALRDKGRPLRAAAFPASHRSDTWLVVREDEEKYVVSSINAAHRRELRTQVFPKRQPPAPVRQTESMLSVRGFKNSVVFPHWSYRRDGEEDCVTWRDLSCLYSPDVALYTLRIRLAKDGTLLQDEFHERW